MTAFLNLCNVSNMVNSCNQNVFFFFCQNEGTCFVNVSCYRENVNCRKVFDIKYRAADKSLARPTTRRILFDGENISFDASFVVYINSTNIPPIMIINRTYENQNLLSL